MKICEKNVLFYNIQNVFMKPILFDEWEKNGQKLPSDEWSEKFVIVLF